MHTAKFTRWVVFFLLIFQIPKTGMAQDKTTDPGKKQEKNVTISVSPIEYDDPAFTSLREIIKTNIKVKQVNPSYTAGTAMLSFLYTGKATELWDELPQTAKQSFKVITMEDAHIGLQLKSNAKISDTAKPLTTTNTAAKTLECVTCIYYKNCSFDTSRTFNGVVYKGWKSSKFYYYYCDNGVLYRKLTDTGNKVYSQIIFKANEPIGTKWADTTMSGVGTHITMAKGLALKVGTKTYNDVMIVYHDFKTIFVNDYYARDSGSIKRDTLDVNFNAVNAAKMKGVVDQSVTGLWKFYNALVDMNMYFKFNGDGTYEYYAGSVILANQMPKGKCYWRLNGNSIELFSSSWDDVVRIRFLKKNDPVTGKATLLIQHSEKEDRAYFSESGAQPWKL
jgi:hypothetical protein